VYSKIFKKKNKKKKLHKKKHSAKKTTTPSHRVTVAFPNEEKNVINCFLKILKKKRVITHKKNIL
jgi:hypothetical protein